ncbi:spr1629 family repressor/antitoxin [Halobacillus salinus]|uniref:spr1629 family repressor/antitoxin n=1 Tax=Halobacillus salinus TaxID=192814 RepID=UPI0009A8BEC7|nr:XRE family transcriptional regulator [Halobacillus salinus]
MFVGENLTNIRILHGYTRKQLAEKLDVTEQAVWQYENKVVSPKMDIVNQLKRIFNVKSKYFYTDDLLVKSQLAPVDSKHIAYRASEMNSVQKTQTEAMHIDFLNGFLKLTNEKLHYPPLELRTLRDRVLEVLMEPSLSRHEAIVSAAELSRDFLELDKYKNGNLLFLLEKKGAFIFEKAIGQKIDAYSVWSKNDFPFIMLGNIKKSAVRRNFDLAHELGHLVLHYKNEFTMLDKKSHREYEHEANLFAANLLLPEEEFKKDFALISKASNPKSYIDLKKKWLVSIQAMALRAHRLSLIDYQKYRYFNILINKFGYKQIEPLDHELKIPKPGKVRSILELLFEKNYLSLDEVLDELQIDIEFLRNLLGIEESFFYKYKVNELKEFSIEDLG